MEKLVSSWYNLRTLPENYVFPPDMRPGNHIPSACETIPVIDLEKTQGDGRTGTIQQIINAAKDYGFFQVVNHGVSEELMENTMNLYREFFDMPMEDKASLYSEDPMKSCRLYTSNDFAKEEVHLWRDILRHPCHPLQDCIPLWPKKPPQYRDVVGAYSIETRNLALSILEMIGEGLGLGRNYFENELTEMQILSVNHYPPCPHPSLTLGLPKHFDPNLITILFQGNISGLQVFKEGEWIGVEPLPCAFVVNIGCQLRVISNGILKSAEHRAVTNSKDARTTVVTFINPSYQSIIEPAKSLIEKTGSSIIFRPFQYKEFLSNYISKVGDPDIVLEPYKLQN